LARIRLSARFALNTAVLAAVFGLLLYIATDFLVLFTLKTKGTGDWRLLAAVYIAVIMLFFSLFSLLLFKSTVLKPLNTIKERADRATVDVKAFMTAGDSRDEIGELSGALGRMTMGLSDDRDRISKQFMEISAQKMALEQAQQQLIRAEKLATVGRLSAGIAHEIGSPLTAVLGYIDLIRADMKAGALPAETGDFLDRMEKEVNRINRIVRELLDYSRPARFEIKDIDLEKAVMDVTGMLRPQKGFKQIEFGFKFEKSGILVRSDWDRLRQVLMNILFNASDSMNGRGLITIQAKEAGAGYAALAIRDTGIGMKADELERIFEPFYTTKVPGQGTGLGLAVSQRLVESMGGRIAVESEPGKGSTFTIILAAGGNNVSQAMSVEG
jgi:signal transduction histidine kinase